MTTFRKLTFAIWPVLGLAGCGSKAEKPAEAPEAQTLILPVAPTQSGGLTDTEWRLVEIQSMDDAQGTKRLDDPSQYTMRLGADGTATLNLNCNKATGTWTSEPAGDGTSGTFGLGPLAATLAACPPPNYDEQISAQAQYLRSYLLRDGRLYLSLMADGGIWVWEPVEGVPFQTTPDPALEDAIRQVEKGYTRAMVEAGGDAGRARYVYGRVDLNADGRREVLVYLLGSIFCGTGGCSMLLFTETADGYQLVSRFSVSRPPVIISGQATKGWSDIIYLQSGGGVASSFVRFAFDGRRYVEKARLPGEPVPAGRPQLVGELTFAKGIPLEPGN